MTKITSPLEGHTGRSVFGPTTLDFKDGVAEIDSLTPTLGAWLKDHGYTVDTSDADAGDDTPSGSWTNDQLKAYAADHGIDLGEASKKADYLEAIRVGKPVEPVQPVKGVETDPGAVGPGEGGELL